MLSQVFKEKKVFLLGSSKFQLHGPYRTTFLRPDILLCTEDFKGKLIKVYGLSFALCDELLYNV